MGRCVGEKSTNSNRIKNFANQMRGFLKHTRVVELGANTFQFVFQRSTDAERILKGGPCIYDNQLLIVQKWKEGIETDEDALKISPLWVQIWGAANPLAQ